jgi:hypothetical protein
MEKNIINPDANNNFMCNPKQKYKLYTRKTGVRLIGRGNNLSV